MDTHSSAELFPTTWSEEMARPTCPPTPETPGRALSSSEALDASRRTSSLDVPAMESHWTSSVRSGRVGTTGRLPSSWDPAASPTTPTTATAISARVRRERPPCEGPVVVRPAPSSGSDSARPAPSHGEQDLGQYRGDGETDEQSDSKRQRQRPEERLEEGAADAGNEQRWNERDHHDQGGVEQGCADVADEWAMRDLSVASVSVATVAAAAVAAAPAHPPRCRRQSRTHPGGCRRGSRYSV